MHATRGALTTGQWDPRPTGAKSDPFPPPCDRGWSFVAGGLRVSTLAFDIGPRLRSLSFEISIAGCLLHEDSAVRSAEYGVQSAQLPPKQVFNSVPDGQTILHTGVHPFHRQ